MSDPWSIGCVGTSGGPPKPSQNLPPVQGKKGQGRAATCRTYTVHVTHEPSGTRMERLIGPAYWSKKKWDAARATAVEDLKKEILKKVKR